MMNKKSIKKTGFTIIELMVVIAIIAFLAMVAIPNFTRFLAKSKRTEAYVNLHALYAAQKAYWAEHGTYSTILNGTNGVGWQPEGYHGGGEGENFLYTYGTASGSEGTAYFTGKLNTAASHLNKGHANKESFLMIAAGDIAGNGKPDIISIDHNNAITILQDTFSD